MTHIPTGIVVMMQEDRSQHRNRAKAMAILRARLYDYERQKRRMPRAPPSGAARSAPATAPSASAPTTFPQGRVSDHRINLTLYKLPQIIEGEALGEIIDALVTEHQAELLAAEGASSMTGAGPRRRPAPERTAVSIDRHGACVGARALARAVRERGLDTPELDARILVGHALGLDHAALAAQSEPRARRRRGGRDRRARRAPAARTSRSRVFSAARNSGACRCAQCRHAGAPAGDRDRGRGRAGCARRRRHRTRTPLRIADLGTGSGALLLALLSELPELAAIGTDISLAALGCARDNAAALGLSDRAAFVACDYGAALAGPFDLVVSNPPYVARAATLPAWQPEVRDFDPRRALDGGPDGLDGYRAIAARRPPPAGAERGRVVELGPGQARRRGRDFHRGGACAAATRHDLSGIARALVCAPRP